MTAQTFPVHAPVRNYTPDELLQRSQAQQRLLQRRREARYLAEQQRAFTPQPRLFQLAVKSNHRPQAPTVCPKPAPTEVMAASLEAAMERVRHPRPGSPAARAIQAVERTRPTIEAAIRRRDARHNALMVYRALAQAAYTLIEHRSQLEHATTYTYFSVLDLLPLVTGLSSDQCERATHKLQDMGLIHKTSGGIPITEKEPANDSTGSVRRQRRYRGDTWTTTTFLDAQTGEQKEAHVCAGTWVAVLLRPAGGRVARVISHELPPCPRDLTADRKVGRTAWQALQETKKEVRDSRLLTGDQFDSTLLLEWSLPKKENSKLLGIIDSRTSLFSDAATPQDLVWSLSRIVSVHPQGRREAVQEGAVRLVTLLNDPGWERHYYRILWRATEAEFRGQPAYSQLAHALERTLIAVKELTLARPGAWLTRQLCDCGWMDAVYRTQQLVRGESN